MPTERNGRHLPPSTARLAAAARAGMFPASPLVTLGAALAAFALVLGFGGEALCAALADLVRDGLEAAAFARPDPVGALAGAIRDGAIIAAPLVVAPAAATLIAAVAPALWARRHGRGSTTAPLPEAPPRTPERAILFCAAAATAALAVAWGFAGVDAAEKRIAEPISTGIFAAGIALLLAGVADLALQRVRLVEALSLTRSEASREDGADASARRSRSEQRAEVRRRGVP
jgi:flagellar biosynthesis protein FlhB